MSLWLVIPSRGLSAGKTRLTSVLSARERIEFNTFCINGVMSAFEAVSGSLRQCIVISPSDDAHALARARGAQPLADATADGLNAAVRQACDHARAHGADQILILAADLPEVRGHHLEKLLDSNPGDVATLIADKTGLGTNGLLIPARAASGFAFGEHSLSRHREHFAREGLTVTLWRDPALAQDIDTPDDLLTWRRRYELGQDQRGHGTGL